MREIVELDATDRQILRILQVDATRPIQEIAEQVSLTTNPCWRRIKRLESTGVISRRAAIVDPTRIGLGTTAFVAVRTDKHTKEWLAAFKDTICNIPEIVECHRMTGDIDYLLKILVQSLTHYDEVYQKLLDTVPDLSDVSSMFSMERLKSDGVIEAPR